MGTGKLIKYIASAGSGKTFELTASYLIKLFTSGKAYRKILAVTFTNKAAAEMKYKILSQLYRLSNGQKTDMAEKLQKETGLTFEELQTESKEILHTILHDYSSFHVGTIDSFFQKVLRVFTREIGIQYGYLIEIEHKQILKQAVEETIENSADDKLLLNWLTEYVQKRIDEEKSWNVRNDVIKLAEEIFKEKFRMMPEEEKKKLADRNLLNEYVSELKTIRDNFASGLTERIQICREILDRHNVSDNMFFGGSRGSIGVFLKKIESNSRGIWDKPNDTVLKVLENPPVWTSRTGPSPELTAAFNDGFQELFLETLQYYNSNFPIANTAILILENIYILGILSDIFKNVHNITTSENRFILSDTGELLYRMIRNDQTPFIYEKAGNTFENFMIDEFQDTSVIQWNNFLPLIENSMASGHENLVVGDVKQSIYRWRNSDWTIFGKQLDKQFDKSRLETKKLDINYRSCRNIVAFNNALFSVIPKLIDAEESNTGSDTNLSSLYEDVLQSCKAGSEGGFVRIEFIQDEETPFKDSVLERLPGLIENLQDYGYRASDIGILVRTNREGADIINSVIRYRASAGNEKTSRYNYSIISGESLFLISSSAVMFIIALFRYLLNPDDKISFALMIRNWLLATGRKSDEYDLTDLNNAAGRLWPEGWKKFINSIIQSPVLEAVENIIRFFSLGLNDENTAFLNALQDCILEFSVNNSSDIPSFLEWWDVYGTGKSLAMSDQQDSIRVMTIHKAKGLEFRIVIVPFLNWPMIHGIDPPVIWVTPPEEPFSKLGLIPLKFRQQLELSLFESDYHHEKYLAKTDNLNLLYVAFTRAREILIGFCPARSKKNMITEYLKTALKTTPAPDNQKPLINLPDYFDVQNGIFRTGEIRQKPSDEGVTETCLKSSGYYVNNGIKRLRLKFHGEKWITRQNEEQQAKINYGKLMHEIFSSVHTIDDIPVALNRMVLDGRISENEKNEFQKKISDAVSRQEIKDWFSPGLKVVTEGDILTKEGTLRRPDRVIISGDKATVIDFKFGGARTDYHKQLNFYRQLLTDMGYRIVDAYIWYVDDNKIVKVE